MGLFGFSASAQILIMWNTAETKDIGAEIHMPAATAFHFLPPWVASTTVGMQPLLSTLPPPQFLTFFWGGVFTGRIFLACSTVFHKKNAEFQKFCKTNPPKTNGVVFFPILVRGPGFFSGVQVSRCPPPRPHSSPIVSGPWTRGLAGCCPRAMPCTSWSWTPAWSTSSQGGGEGAAGL